MFVHEYVLYTYLKKLLHSGGGGVIGQLMGVVHIEHPLKFYRPAGRNCL